MTSTAVKARMYTTRHTRRIAMATKKAANSIAAQKKPPIEKSTVCRWIV